jgi:hypothetical protein
LLKIPLGLSNCRIAIDEVSEIHPILSGGHEQAARRVHLVIPIGLGFLIDVVRGYAHLLLRTTDSRPPVIRGMMSVATMSCPPVRHATLGGDPPESAGMAVPVQVLLAGPGK